jgi:hypothetical protein
VKRLIVNADDFGRTPGVNAGVIEAHLEGLVTSATAMVLEPAAEEGIREALARAPGLDLGLHVVLTGGGAPASPPARVPTLAPSGNFRRDAAALPERLPAAEIEGEIDAQIARFERIAGRPPSHLDSHHHAALHPDVLPVFAEAAARRRLPARAASDAARTALQALRVRTPDRFFDGFYGGGATRDGLLEILRALPDGTSELMCHPARPDAALRAGSTYAEERARELAILTDRGVLAEIRRLEIDLTGFSRV